MAKFYGKIGYVSPVETAPDVWEEVPVERNYRGDVVLSQQRWQPADQANKNFNLDNSISILADEYAYTNVGRIRYIVWHGQKWEITSLNIIRPRMVLQIGGVYNGG